MRPSRNTFQKISIPKTADGCSPTITSSFGEGVGVTNLLDVGHFPKGGGTLYHPIMKKKILINPDSGGASRTIMANYYKSGIANFIRTDGRAANAVLIITKL